MVVKRVTVTVTAGGRAAAHCMETDEQDLDGADIQAQRAEVWVMLAWVVHIERMLCREQRLEAED